MEPISVILLISTIVLGVWLVKLNKKYKELRRISYRVLEEKYGLLVLEKMTYLYDKQGKENYEPEFKRATYNLRQKLATFPKDLKYGIWYSLVSKHDSILPRAQSGAGVMGRALWYNEFKEAVGLQFD